jgi:hypothetical protein
LIRRRTLAKADAAEPVRTTRQVGRRESGVQSRGGRRRSQGRRGHTRTTVNIAELVRASTARSAAVSVGRSRSWLRRPTTVIRWPPNAHHPRNTDNVVNNKPPTQPCRAGVSTMSPSAVAGEIRLIGTRKKSPTNTPAPLIARPTLGGTAQGGTETVAKLQTTHAANRSAVPPTGSSGRPPKRCGWMRRQKNVRRGSVERS